MASIKISKARQEQVIKYLVERKYPESTKTNILEDIAVHILKVYNASLPEGIEKYDMYLNKSNSIGIRLPDDTFYIGDSIYSSRHLYLDVADGYILNRGMYRLTYEYTDVPMETKKLIDSYFVYTKEVVDLKEKVQQVVLGLTTSKKLLDAFPELEEVFLWLRSDTGNALVDVKSIMDVRAKLGLPA